ncbi:hypothetical protein E2C01_064216 [Portunus trituberculatus]|uniref:Uncharacterized protein n=1 Tax=Portunus trituberculatus TaxID=210409 RepID=A0A5B7HIH1_PORTR|nr:hypothetical protein [Portunus trituberculatus]
MVHKSQDPSVSSSLATLCGSVVPPVSYRYRVLLPEPLRARYEPVNTLLRQLPGFLVLCIP